MPVRRPPVSRCPYLLAALILALPLLGGCGSGSGSGSTAAQVPSLPSVTAPTGNAKQSAARKPKPAAPGTTGDTSQVGHSASQAKSSTSSGGSKKPSSCLERQNALAQKIRGLDPSSPQARKLSRKLHKLAETGCGTHAPGSASGSGAAAANQHGGKHTPSSVPSGH